METRKIIISSLLAILCLNGSSQSPEPQWGIKFSGFVKTDMFYDTRQSSASTGIREGHFYLYPDNSISDAEGKDINANPSFHILNIQSRLKGDITGPDAFGAKTSGVIEAEFFGTSESDLNGFRLRHAFLKLDWTRLSLMMGQNWHPLFPAESFPGTLSFNTGAPFTPFSRNPQVRLNYKAGIAGLQFTAYSQRDFVSTGPDGSSNKYIRNSGLPGFNLQAKIPAGDIFTAWGGVDFKKLRPELRTSANFETDASVGSMVLFTTLRIRTEPLTVSLMGTYAQNATDLVMLGGYAVTSVTDPLRQYKKYTTLNSANLWVDMSTNGSKVSVGLFAGYAKNLGSSDEINGAFYTRGSNIDNLFRISPRIIFTSGKVSIGSEIEMTSAAYGLMQSNGKVNDAESVTNVRILLSSIYRF
jgi:hypothetical protein